jgi:hypothetical protein
MKKKFERLPQAKGVAFFSSVDGAIAHEIAT